MRVPSAVRHLSLALCLVLGLGFAARAENAPVIAAAADLKFALEEVAAKFKTEAGKEVKLSFGSSGNFVRQLQEGAPYQLFLSADEAFVFKLADAGKTIDRGTLYAEGRIVLFAPTGSTLKPDAQFTDLQAALGDGRIKRFAIANPEHAPYGRAAEQALRHQKLWDTIKPKLVLGENVAQAADFASSGSAQGGIFAFSLARSPKVSGRGTFVLVPADYHAPLRQRMVLLKDAGETAKAFYAYVQKPAARTIFRKYGFVLPGESS